MSTTVYTTLHGVDFKYPKVSVACKFSTSGFNLLVFITDCSMKLGLKRERCDPLVKCGGLYMYS